MSSSRRKWKFRLRHIIEAIEKIQRYTDGMSLSEFLDDQLTSDAVLRNFMVIGEAARYVPESMVAAFPEVPWADMRGMRNVVAHEYDRVRLVTIWATIHNDLPPLVPLLQRVLEEAEE